MTGRAWYAPDPSLPDRDAILDEQALARHLATLLPLPGGRVESVTLARAKYLPGASLRIVCRVRAGGEIRLVSGRMFPAGISDRVAAAAQAGAEPSGPLRPVTVDRGLSTVWWAFPNDRRLRGLSALDPPAVDLAAPLHGRWRRSRIVSLTPEKAAIAACLDDAGDVLAYAKVYADDRGERIEAIHAGLRSAVPAEVGVPAVIASIPARRALLLEPMRGRPIAELPDRELPAALRALGRALALVHGAADAGASSELPPVRHLAPDRLAEAAAVLGAAFPALAEAAAALCEELETSRSSGGGPDVWLHGDLHLANALVSGGRIAMIDLDQCARGPAAADLGVVLARLRYRRRLGGLPPGDEIVLRNAFLDGYRSGAILSGEAELRWHTAAALLAVRLHSAVTRVRAESFPHLARLIGDAEELLAGAPARRA